ncbi:MAG: hypothetical protein ACOY5V_06555 [Pseudomonadota bacterium]
MTVIITPSIAEKLALAVERFKQEVEVPPADAWKSMSDGLLWLRVLEQIAVVGKAASGRALREELGSEAELWWSHLKPLPESERQVEIHRRLRSAGVRYVMPDSAECKKTKAAVYDFGVLESYGGPRQYFAHLASVPMEPWRISAIVDEMAYIKDKGARDLLIELGLVRDAIAFDTRLKAVLERLGAELPKDLATNRARYKALERELLSKVCVPCGVSGGHLDRILFNHWQEVG